MDCLCYKGGCASRYGMYGHVRIEVFKKELAWAKDKQL